MNLDREKLKALANGLAKDIKTEKDLNALSAELLKMTVEAGTGPPCSESTRIFNGLTGYSRLQSRAQPIHMDAENSRNRGDIKRSIWFWFITKGCAIFEK